MYIKKECQTFFFFRKMVFNKHVVFLDTLEKALYHCYLQQKLLMPFECNHGKKDLKMNAEIK